MTTPTDLKPGDRVAVLSGLPKAYGRPLADVVRVNPTTVTVRLCYDGTDHRLDASALMRRPDPLWDADDLDDVLAEEVPTEGTAQRQLARQRFTVDLGGGRTERRQFCTVCHVIRPVAVTRAIADRYPVQAVRRFHYCHDHADQARSPIVVIGCGARKRPDRAPAAELYTGSYFAAALRAARALTAEDRIFVLSARYGLVALDTELEPYDLKLSDLGDRRAFGVRLARQAVELGIDDVGCIALAGAQYRAALTEAVGARYVVTPGALSAARGIGDHLAYFRQLADAVA